MLYLFSQNYASFSMIASVEKNKRSPDFTKNPSQCSDKQYVFIQLQISVENNATVSDAQYRSQSTKYFHINKLFLFTSKTTF